MNGASTAASVAAEHWDDGVTTKRQAKKPASRRAKAEEPPAAPGVAMRMAERLIENPAMSGGLLVMALTAAAIISNAIVLQNGRHPEPLFMTRPAAVEPDPVPLPRVRVAPPPAAKPVAVKPAPAETLPAKKVVAALQRELAERGLYGGEIDGVAGSRTKAAVVAYQKSAGLRPTGEASAAVLDHIRTASIKPAPTPPSRPEEEVAVVKSEPAPSAPAAPPPTPAVEIPAPTPVALEAPTEPIEPPPAPAATAIETKPVAPAPAEAAGPVEPVAPVAVAKAEPAPAAAPATPDPAAVARERNRSIQHALNEIGYGPVPEDGKTGQDTADAIRRFELDNGLPITGLPEGRVIDRLIAIGALEPI